MTVLAAARWTEGPVRRFVEDSGVRIALLVQSSGQVMAQYGFARSLDVMSASALAAAINATAGRIGTELEGRPFAGSHIAGSQRQIFIAPIRTANGEQILLAVFDGNTSIGVVRVYFEELAQALQEVAPVREGDSTMRAEDFEGELNRNLAALFGRI